MFHRRQHFSLGVKFTFEFRAELCTQRREASKRAVNYRIRSNVNFLKALANVINELKIRTVEIGIIGIGFRVGTNFAVIAPAT